MAGLQHSKKFVEEVRATEVRQTPMFAGDSEISRRSAHSQPYLTRRSRNQTGLHYDA